MESAEEAESMRKAMIVNSHKGRAHLNDVGRLNTNHMIMIESTFNTQCSASNKVL